MSCMKEDEEKVKEKFTKHTNMIFTQLDFSITTKIKVFLSHLHFCFYMLLIAFRLNMFLLLYVKIQQQKTHNADIEKCMPPWS